MAYINHMKGFITAILILVATLGFSQDLKKIVKTFKTPDGWSGELKMDSVYVPSFGKKAIATWTFVCKTKKIQPVIFYVFSYTKADSAEMDQKAIMYYATSSCLVASNQDIRQNSMSFVRGNYYFTEKMCPCYTTGSVECETMVKQMSDWINKVDKTKEF